MKNREFSQDPSPLYLFTNFFFDNPMFQMWRKHLNECVVTLPRFHVHQIAGKLKMNGGRDEQERIGSKPAVYG